MSAELPNRLFELLKKREVLDADAFCRRLLGEILRWPLPDLPLDEFAYAWTPDELGLNGDARELAANVRQLPNLTPNQPWGVFIVEMREDGLFRRERGLAGILRRMLGKLVTGKSKPGDQPSWRREELLFIVTHAYQDFRFAYFKAPREGMKSPSLAAFGW
ncbi:MAG: hypothetical protein LBU23_13100, partial [Planctomycetota bacterium]|nr:hypothetical protein [Planctomycetota bacterium]